MICLGFLHGFESQQGSKLNPDLHREGQLSRSFWIILLRILCFRKEGHPWVYPAQALMVGENARTNLNKEQAYIDEDNNIPK